MLLRNSHKNQVEAYIRLGELLQNQPYLIADLEVEKLLVLAHNKIIISHLMKVLFHRIPSAFIIADEYILPEVGYADMVRTNSEIMRFTKLLRRYYAHQSL